MTRMDAWLSTAATAGLWICLGWLLVGFAFALLAEAPGTIGRACGLLADRVSPRVLRRLARLAIGLVFAVVSVGGAGAAAGAAGAASTTREPGWPSRPTQSSNPVLSRLPDLDRPALAAGWTDGGTGGPQQARLPRLPTAVPPIPTTLPRLPTGSAPPAATVQPDYVQTASGRSISVPPPGSGQPGSGQPADPETRSPTERPTRDSAVVVVPGDTLWDIAARELGGEPSNREIAERWPRWYASNRAEIGPDPDVILPGQRLSPPADLPSHPGTAAVAPG